MRAKLSAFIFVLGAMPTIYPLVITPRYLVLGFAGATLVALLAAVAWPRRVGAVPWTFLVLVTYTAAVSLENGSLDLGGPLLGIAALLVLEGTDLLQVVTSSTQIQPGLFTARLRHFGKVAALGLATSTAVLGGSLWTNGNSGAVLAVATMAALGAVALSVSAIGKR